MAEAEREEDPIRTWREQARTFGMIAGAAVALASGAYSTWQVLAPAVPRTPEARLAELHEQLERLQVSDRQQDLAVRALQTEIYAFKELAHERAEAIRNLVVRVDDLQRQINSRRAP